MADNSDDVGFTEVVVAQTFVVDQNQLILYLMQHIADLNAKMQKKQDLPNLIFLVNPLGEGRPTLNFPPQS